MSIKTSKDRINPWEIKTLDRNKIIHRQAKKIFGVRIE
jgi:hypothetical protein